MRTKVNSMDARRTISRPPFGEGEPSVRHKDKITYILGAGFAHPTGMPVLNRFIPESFQLLKEDPHRTYDELLVRVASIIRHYQNVAAAVGIDLCNLEDLFCLAELGVPDQGESNDQDTLKEFIVRSVDAAWKRHEEAHKDTGRRSRFCLPKDSAVTGAPVSLKVRSFSSAMSARQKAV